MTKAEKIDKLRTLTKAFALFSASTKLPFVECEQGNYYDQAFIYEKREDAEEAAKSISESGYLVGISELSIVEMEPPKDEKLGEPVRKLMRNQIRELLMKLPLLGINAVYFKPAEGSGEVLEMDYVLPDEVKAYVEKEKTDRTALRLTGMYFSQYLHLKEKDMERLKELSEEYYANLVNVPLLMPVVPPQDMINSKELNITQCKIPILPIKKGDTGEKSSFVAMFTNMDEVVAYCRINGDEKVARVIEMPIENIVQLVDESVVGFMIDPITLNIPVDIKYVPELVEKLKRR